jgi:hypothetical protein
MAGVDGMSDDLDPNKKRARESPREGVGGPASSNQPAPQPTLSDLMAAIQAGNQQMSRKFEEVQLKQLETDRKIETISLKQDDVERRLVALESRPAVASTIPFPPAIACPSAASGSGVPSRASSAAGDRGRDIVYEADPWSKGRGKGKLQQARDPDFQPSRAWLRGWSPYHKDFGQRRSISQEAAEALAKQFLDLVPADLAQKISVIDPSYRNFQVSVVLKDTCQRDSAFYLASLVKKAGLKVECQGQQYNVYLAIEQEPWRTERTRYTKAAMTALRGCYPAFTARFHEDLNLGCVWLKFTDRDDLQLGRFLISELKWSWSESALSSIQATLERLEPAMFDALV